MFYCSGEETEGKTNLSIGTTRQTNREKVPSQATTAARWPQRSVSSGRHRQWPAPAISSPHQQFEHYNLNSNISHGSQCSFHFPFCSTSIRSKIAADPVEELFIGRKRAGSYQFIVLQQTELKQSSTQTPHHGGLWVCGSSNSSGKTHVKNWAILPASTIYCYKLSSLDKLVCYFKKIIRTYSVWNSCWIKRWLAGRLKHRQTPATMVPLQYQVRWKSEKGDATT